MTAEMAAKMNNVTQVDIKSTRRYHFIKKKSAFSFCIIQTNKMSSRLNQEKIQRLIEEETIRYKTYIESLFKKRNVNKYFIH
jgi:hypothetical protein